MSSGLDSTASHMDDNTEDVAGTASEVDDNTKDVPISARRLHECLHSAGRWSRELPLFADHCQRKADFWAILAGVLAAISASSIISTIFAAVGPDPTWVKAAGSVCALVASISALIPRVKGYAEESGAARVLAAQYGSLYGRLMDLAAQEPVNIHAAQATVTEFQAVKEKKDLLRGLGTWKHPPPPAGEARAHHRIHDVTVEELLKRREKQADTPTQ